MPTNSITRWGHYFNIFGLQVIEAFPGLVCRIPSSYTARNGNVYDYPAQATQFSANLGGGLTFPFWEDPTLDATRITEGSVLVLDPTQPQPIQAIQRSKRPVVAYVRYSSGNIRRPMYIECKLRLTLALPPFKRIAIGSWLL